MNFISRKDILVLVNELSYLISEYDDAAKTFEDDFSRGFSIGCVAAYSVCRELLKELISDAT